MRIFGVITSLLLVFNLTSQVELLNSSLIEPSVPIAYKWYDNKLQLNIGISIDSVLIIDSDLDTLKNLSDFIRYIPKNVDRMLDTLRVFQNGVLLTEKVYSLKNLGPPSVFLGSIRDSFVTKEQLLENQGLITSYEPQLAKSCTRINCFKSFIIKRDGKVRLLKSKKTRNSVYDDKKYFFIVRKDRYCQDKSIGNKFDKRQLKKINRMRKGDVLFIESVVVGCSSCSSRYLILNFRFIVQ